MSGENRGIRTVGVNTLQLPRRRPDSVETSLRDQRSERHLNFHRAAAGTIVSNLSLQYMKRKDACLSLEE